MDDSSIENRLDTLEQQVRRILGVIQGANSEQRAVKDWRQSLGMFNDRPGMKQIDEEGKQIRQQNISSFLQSYSTR